MSPAGDFVNFFPAAPRSAKMKAKALADKTNGKSMVASYKSENPTSLTDANATTKGDEIPRTAAQNPNALGAADMAVDDNASSPGDVLNGVGSASSHTSAGSSLFSAAGPAQVQASNAGGAWSNLTPLTNVDTSPTERTMTPSQPKTTSISVHSQVYGQTVEMKPEPDQKQSAAATTSDAQPRTLMRDPDRLVQGERCTYDPRLEGSKDKHAKPTYMEFGTVRTYNLWGVSSCFV